MNDNPGYTSSRDKSANYAAIARYFECKMIKEGGSMQRPLSGGLTLSVRVVHHLRSYHLWFERVSIATIRSRAIHCVWQRKKWMLI
jgi:hypothetical protein